MAGSGTGRTAAAAGEVAAKGDGRGGDGGLLEKEKVAVARARVGGGV